MTWLDFVILAVMAWFTLTAYLSGLIRETIGLASVILAVVLAGLYHDNLAENLLVFTDNATAARIGAFLAIFVAVALVGGLLALFLRTAADLLFLGWADRAGGAAFGFLKAVLIIQAVTVIFVLQPTWGMDTAIANSLIGSFFLDAAPIVRALLPDEFDQALSDFAA